MSIPGSCHVVLSLQLDVLSLGRGRGKGRSVGLLSDELSVSMAVRVRPFAPPPICSLLCLPAGRLVAMRQVIVPT